MKIARFDALACPIDGLPLTEASDALRCERGHTYDRAREGYWNLLLVQHKASADPGDSKAMVAARQRFLAAGHYAPIAHGVFEVLLALARERGRTSAPFRIVDAGAGEGDYLTRIAEAARASSDNGSWQLGGYDVSKWAVRAAAKRRAGADGITWLVANSSHPPIGAGRIDAMLCLFGFPVWEGFQRALANDGAVVMVDPGPDHLVELRRIIYPTLTPTMLQSLSRAVAQGFVVADTRQLQFAATLDSADAIRDLVAMTPHAHRMPDAGRAALSILERLTVTVDVAVRVLRPASGAGPT